jgi:ribose 5-phosphate isomerase A
MDRRDQLKRQAAHRAVSFVRSGMVVGLGSGSTSFFAVERIGQLLAEGTLRNILGIPTSVQTETAAASAGIPLTSFACSPEIDLTIDGADEVDSELNLIKGGGGALLREKIVAQASRRLVIIVDEEKLSVKLGSRWPVPVEVVPFAQHTEEIFLRSLGAAVAVRRAGCGSPGSRSLGSESLFETDQGNLILDANFGPIEKLGALIRELDERAGIAGHGLFGGMADEVIVAGKTGIRHLFRPAAQPVTREGERRAGYKDQGA